jgi:hypothetical protein
LLCPFLLVLISSLLESTFVRAAAATVALCYLISLLSTNNETNTTVALARTGRSIRRFEREGMER